METWTVAQGSTVSRIVTFNDEHGSALAFTGSETLGGSVWIGEDQAPLILLTPTWSSASLGQAAVEFDAVISAGPPVVPLDIGQYRVSITVDYNDGYGPTDAFDALLKVTWAPGTEVPQRVYCSYEDVLRVARWVEQVQDPEEDQAGFLAQRVQAREEIDDAIVSCYRGTSIGQFGLASLSAIGWAGGGPRRSNMTSYLVREYLNGRNPGFPSDQTSPTGFLMRRSTIIDPGIYNPASTPALKGLTSDQKLDFYAKADRPMTNRIAAYRTAALIGLGQIGTNNTHATYGAVCNSQFERLMTAYTAELDINLDGLCEIAIKCGSTNTLYT